MRFKEGVKIKGMTPELVVGLMIMDSVYRFHGVDMVITSVVEADHMPGSKHYCGCAADLRIRNLTPTLINDIYREAKDALGKNYDLVLEKDHLHLEYDPK